MFGQVKTSITYEAIRNTYKRLQTLARSSQVSKNIQESWAVAVEWFITQKEYRERGISDYSGPLYNVNAGYPIRWGHQDWRYGIGIDNYSCIFIDLVDNHNQVGRFSNALTDNVAGYDIPTIEATFLKHIYGFSSLKYQLKANKPSGVTDAQIDELLDQF